LKKEVLHGVLYPEAQRNGNEKKKKTRLETKKRQGRTDHTPWFHVMYCVVRPPIASECADVMSRSDYVQYQANVINLAPTVRLHMSGHQKAQTPPAEERDYKVLGHCDLHRHMERNAQPDISLFWLV